MRTCFLTYFGTAVLLLARSSSAKPLPSPPGACDSSGSYFEVLNCFKILQNCPETTTLHIHINKQDLRRTIQRFEDDCLNRPAVASKRSRQSTSGTRVLDVEAPLSTTYLMSLQQTATSDDSTVPWDYNKQGAVIPSRVSESDNDITDLSNEDFQRPDDLLCLKHFEGRMELHCGSQYWDQDHGMDLVIVIVVLFLAVVLIVETAEGLLKLSVLLFLFYLETSHG